MKKGSKEYKLYVKEYNKRYREANRDKLNQYHQSYQDDHYADLYTKTKERRAQRYLEDAKSIKAVQRAYRESHREELRERARLRSLTPEGRFSSYRDNAKRRNIVFDITLEEFKSFWQKPCLYCGDAIETIGLDRVDSSLGYILSNLVSCCWICQRAKSDLPLEEFNEWIKRLIGHGYLPKRD